MRSRLIAALGAVFLTAGCSVFGGQAAPEVSYSVVRSDGVFEIRDYPEVRVARVSLPMPQDEGSGRAFGKLFDYISGENTGQREIDMTAPVFMEGQDISMTAPVFGSDSAAGFTMEFALPESLGPAPLPLDPAVQLASRPPMTFAVRRFSGFLNEDSVAEEGARLLEWMEEQGLVPAGPLQWAGYNPPWTLPFLRRNEVMVAVGGPGT